MEDKKKCIGSGDCNNCQYDDCVFNGIWDEEPDAWFEQFVDTIPVE